MFMDKGMGWISKALEYSRFLRSAAEGMVQPFLLRVSKHSTGSYL